MNAGQSAQIAAKIRSAMTQVQSAFHQQLSALEEFRFINLESEMDVLAQMLAGDGLIGREKEAQAAESEEDPFAALFEQGGGK